ISTSRVNDEELYSVLLIRKVLTIDFDAYNCTASNSMGLSWASTRLIESTNFPVHFMMPGVVGGVLAILVIALAIVWANK
uniref:Uncharacterized protein n=1 Tax=Romanomermis culicivorax TaxID=13658 RepID=A0A915I872_ROMCU